MIVIVDYRAGNLTSVQLAFESIGVAATITQDPAVVRKASRIVFPGVGAAGAAMQSIHELGLDPALRAAVAGGTPFLGICVGTQILFEASEEDGGVVCLGLLPGTVRRFRPTNTRDKVPQIGWNAVIQRRGHPIFSGITSGSEVYFVHSYYPDATDAETVLGQTAYAGVNFASVVGRGNLVATQFHVEKSGRVGLQLLRNFMNWTPAT